MDYRLINLIHILLVAPLFWYIGSNGAETDQRVFNALKYTSVGIVLYHSFLLISRSTRDNFNEMNNYDEQSDDESDVIQLRDGEL